MKLKQLKEKFYKIISKLLNKTIVLKNKDGTTLMILPNGSTILSLKGRDDNVVRSKKHYIDF